MSNDTAITSIKEKINDLNQQAWEVRVTDLPKSFELSQESVKLARSISYPKGLAEGLRSLGFSYVRYSKNDEAAPLLKESLSLYQSLNDLKGQAVVYEYLGIIERNWGNLGASLDLLLKANKLVLQIDSQEIEITCSYQLGVTYKHLGDHENALDYLYKTLSLAKKMNFTLMEAYATNIIGSIYFDNGNYNQALDCYQQGLIIRRESHDKWGEAGSLDNIGFTYLKLNDLDKAIDHCKQSLAICQATGDKKGEANTLLHLGEIYEQAGDIKQAAGFSKESLEIRKDRGDKRGETEVLLFLADLFKNRNDVEDHQIFEWLSGALKIADEIKAQDLLSKTHYNLHGYYQQKGNFKESLIQLESHFKIEKELHKNSINQKIANLEISHKAEVVSQRNKELTELNDKIEKANEELKIEASLEKIRSRSLAMHKSDELKDVITVVFEKLKELGLVFEDVGIYLFTEGKKDSVIWVAAPVHLSEPILVNLPYSEKIFEESEIFRDYWMAKEKGENTFNKTYSYNDKNRYFDYLEKSNISDQVPVSVREFQMQAAGYTATLVTEKHSALWIDSWSGQTISIEGFNVLKRVTRVFEQAYTRFLDLQKAEAQARESQIEAALERVRSRTMGMQKSEELKDVIQVVYEQFVHLNVHVEHTGFIMDYKERSDMHIWLADKHAVPFQVTLPYFDCAHWNSFNEAKEKGMDFFANKLSFEEKNKFYQDLFKLIPGLPEETLKYYFGCPGLAISTVLLDNVGLYIENFSGIPYSDEENATLMRFGKVFQQTYTRFLDLQKAEAQAREAKIEAALEKVRSRTMAMQKSDELAEVATILFQQVKALGVPQWTCGFGIFEIDDKEFTWYPGSPDGDILPPGKIPLTEHPVFISFNDSRKRGDELFIYEKEGEYQAGHYRYMQSLPGVGEILQRMLDAGLTFPTFQIDHVANFSHGNLVFITYEHFPEMHDIFKRFAKVFEQTYTRFLDLQKAEAQARESQIEGALEKVRSRTLAMQKSDELAETAAEVFRQLIALGIEPNRLYIGIVKEETGDMEMWATDEDGTQVGKRFMFNKNENASVLKLYDGWKTQKKSVIVDMQGKELEDYFHYLNNVMHIPFKGGLTQKRRVQSVAYFSKGFIGMASPDGQGDETIQLLERFAAVFNLTFTRFNDLKIAEAHAVQAEEDLVKLQTEKKRAEDALSELQVTQKQLIQAEKMASLGELTAGIAHEIQNPLNFVNNFSDVNKELLVEMKEEIEKGNTEEVIAIANDIISNEEKINHHGKRADAIVKGMLQHSRSSSGVKEPTDINELADEYLRLAYHGLRAKDKSFNATMKTDFDEAVGKVNVIPQEIGRVFLNLITNAFYVVAEKKKHASAGSAANGYEPTVTVTTKKENDKVVVSVKDNGSGIPQKVLDKIFQPFFTTKPTGQGTGLGLSLSYDIVKAHSGEIKVLTKDGEGSEFVIQLPVV